MNQFDPSVSDADRGWAAATHLGALVLAFLTSWAAGVAGILVAGAVYFLKRNDSAFVAGHAREALNFNLSMFIYSLLVYVAIVVLVGATVFTLGIGAILTVPAGLLLLVLIAVVLVAWLVCSLIATVKAWNGESYRYPFTLRLIK